MLCVTSIERIVGIGAELGEESLVERALGFVEVEERGQRDVLGREPGEDRVELQRAALRGTDKRLDVGGGDESRLLDRAQIDAVLRGELGRAARDVCRTVRLRLNSAVPPRLCRRELLRVRRDNGDRAPELDLAAGARELDEGPVAGSLDLDR